MTTKPLDSIRSICNSYSTAYAYIIWFMHRKMKTSFRSMEWFSRFQASVAPMLPLVCYFMTVFFLIEYCLPARIPKWMVFGFIGLFVLGTVVLVSRWSDEGRLARQFALFSELSTQRRRWLDTALGLFLLAAIPLAVFAAVLVRDKFVTSPHLYP